MAHGYGWERHALRLVAVDIPVAGLKPEFDLADSFGIITKPLVSIDFKPDGLIDVTFRINKDYKVPDNSTVTLTAAPTYSASSIVFQADTGSGFSTINTDSASPFTYTYDVSGIANGTLVTFRAVEGVVNSNTISTRIGGSLNPRGIAQSCVVSILR